MNSNLPKQSGIIGSKQPGKYIEGIYRKMFGVVIYKSWAEIFQLEALLNEYPCSTIIELGTGFGSTTIFLGAHSFMKGAKVFSYDDKPTVTEPVQKIFDALDVTFEVIDIFENEKKIIDLINRPGRTLLYCDNGDKSKELSIWGYHLKKGDIALVHDYPEEIPQYILDEAIDLYGLEPFEEEWFSEQCASHRALIKS